jgi:hypothetical protein
MSFWEAEQNETIYKKMREELEKIENERGTFIGTFVRTGIKIDFGHEKQTILLKNVKDKIGNLVTDHLWFNLTKGFEVLQLIENDVVQFDARVKSYEKGYKGRIDGEYWDFSETDYKLSHPTKITKIKKA